MLSKNAVSYPEIWLKLRGNIDAYEVYINGQVIVTNGTVGNSENNEIVGKHIKITQIPFHLLRKGQNHLSIKFSNYSNPDRVVFRDISLSSYEKIASFEKVMTTAPMFFAGIFIFAVFINIGLYYSLGRQQTFLYMSVLFMLNFLVMVHEVFYWNGYVNLLASFGRLNLKTLFEFLIYVSLVSYLYFEYRLNRMALMVSVLPSLLMALFFPHIPTMVAFSVAPFLYGLQVVMKQLPNSRLIVTSLAVLLSLNILDGYNLVDELSFANNNLLLTSFIYKLDNIGMIMVLIVMIMGAVQKILSSTEKLSAAQLRIQKLEYQFLQKQIQPHFIVNSLMALQQLIAKDAKTAMKMVKALSEHFYLLSKSSSKKVIPIEQEINLCREFLAVMSCQQRADYDLVVEGVDGDELIPPAIFHTIIENGITHGFTGPQQGKFYIIKKKMPNSLRYRLTNNGSLTSEKTSSATSGMGTRYIETKLEEWKPGKWSLSSKPDNTTWVTIIEVRD